MSLQDEIYIAPPTNNLVANLQNGVANVPLVLNNTDVLGNVIDPARSFIPCVIIPNAEKKITITSVNNLTGVDFTLSGYNIFNQPISEVLTGANANTATSVLNYHKINSVIPNNAANAVQIGVSDNAISRWMILDTNRTNSSFPTIQINVAGTIEYTVYGTASKPFTYNQNGYNFPNVLSFPVSNSLTNASTNQIEETTIHYQAIAVEVNSADPDGELQITLLQPGI